MNLLHLVIDLAFEVTIGSTPVLHWLGHHNKQLCYVLYLFIYLFITCVRIFHVKNFMSFTYIAYEKFLTAKYFQTTVL